MKAKVVRRRMRQLKSGQPGQRFQQYHARRRSDRQRPLLRMAFITAGIVLLLVGVVLMPAPGPGLLVVAAGGALLAGQSTLAARAMDRAELAVRGVLRWVRARKR